MPRSRYALFCPQDHRRPGTNQFKRNTFTREENNSDIIVQRECGGGGGGGETKHKKYSFIYLFDRFHHDRTAKMLKS